MSLCFSRDRGGSLWIRTEYDTALLHIGAGYVELDGGYAGNIHHSCQLAVFLHCASGDIHNDIHVVLFNTGQDFLQKSICTGVFQSDAIQHARRGFCDAYAIIAAARLQGCSLHHHRAQCAEVQEISKFLSKAESA